MEFLKERYPTFNIALQVFKKILSIWCYNLYCLYSLSPLPYLFSWTYGPCQCAFRNLGLPVAAPIWHNVNSGECTVLVILPFYRKKLPTEPH